MTSPEGVSPDVWHVHGERMIYDNKWVSVGLADISQPSGQRFEHHTVTLPAAAMTVVLDDGGRSVLLSWRHRFVPDLWNWELPGGLRHRLPRPSRLGASPRVLCRIGCWWRHPTAVRHGLHRRPQARPPSRRSAVRRTAARDSLMVTASAGA
ncbi:hypothetical protein [Pseudonocardia sp. NPDC046786]|uniref:hypothetical protein n=1 Tax=Pseudonocardia sp. NPDC046786 TaxID=3155471 RepID=UPI0033F7A9ED